jgi:transcriptional regulator with XRE-family HTH domain
MKDLGIRLKRIREEKGLNQREFAKEIGISQGMLSGIENGIEKFSERTRKIVCLRFGIENNWLLTGQGPMFTPPKPSPEAILGQGERELTPEEQELLEIYDKLTPEIQKEVRNYANEKLELQDFREKAGKEAPKQAPEGTTQPLEVPQEGERQESTG